MEGINLIVMLVIGICIFMFSVYFTRWVFGIDKIIELQKEQTKLLRQIASKSPNQIESDESNNQDFELDQNVLDSLKKANKSI